MKDVEKKLVSLLADEALEKQMAAAILLGELDLKSTATLQALVRVCASPLPPLRKHALRALANLGAGPVLEQLWPLLLDVDAEIRAGAAHAIARAGEEALPAVRKRLAQTTHAHERRALESILAELGGRDALGTLLASLDTADAEAAKAAALAVRAQLKGADARTRKSYLAELTKFLERAEAQETSPQGVATALKIIGYLEDERALPVLARYARDAAAPPSVRQEAVIALRFAWGARAPEAELVDAFAEAALADDRSLAQTALHSLAALAAMAAADPKARATLAVGKRLQALLQHRDLERAKFVLELLAKQPGAEATRLLAATLLEGDRARAELAAAALRDRADAAPVLAKALLGPLEADRAWLVRQVLRPHARALPAPLRKELLAALVQRMKDEAHGFEALLEIAHEASPDETAAALRTLVAALRKAKKPEREAATLRRVVKHGGATDEERARLACLALASTSREDTRPQARGTDEALRLLEALEQRGFDAGRALRGDKGLEDTVLYYVGFHFAERGAPLGEELLREVVQRGPRTKLGKMAKNKLALTAGPAD